jgi:hypothetical protein
MNENSTCTKRGQFNWVFPGIASPIERCVIQGVSVRLMRSLYTESNNGDRSCRINHDLGLSTAAERKKPQIVFVNFDAPPGSIAARSIPTLSSAVCMPPPMEHSAKLAAGRQISSQTDAER